MAGDRIPSPSPIRPVAARRMGGRSFVLLTVFTLLALTVLVALGTWQVQRLAWKEALIARVNDRIASEPQPLPSPDTWPALSDEEIEYRPVRLTGTFDHDRELHVFIALTQPRGPVGGQGYFVMTPLRLESGETVFVNRGFVPQERKDPATRPDGQVEGVQTIEGLMRPPEQTTWISPSPNPQKNIWWVRDPAIMAEAVGLDPARVAPFTVDAFAGGVPGGLPQGGETVVSFTNNHLGYAITWYGLALALLAVYASVALKRVRPGA